MMAVEGTRLAFFVEPSPTPPRTPHTLAPWLCSVRQTESKPQGQDENVPRVNNAVTIARFVGYWKEKQEGSKSVLLSKLAKVGTWMIC